MIPTFNPLPDDKLLDWFKLKQTASDILKSIHNEKSVPYRVENIVGKKEKLLVTSNFSFSHNNFLSYIS